MTYWPGPGYRMAAAAHGGIRASDQDRERAAEVLKTGFAEGRLTKDEYDEHLSRIYAARTVGDLATLTSQLPGGGAALLPVPAGPPRTNPMAVASMICGVAEFFTFGLTSIPGGHPGPCRPRPDPADRRGGRRAGPDRAHPGLAGVALWLLFWAGVLVAGVAFGHGPVVHPMHIRPGGTRCRRPRRGG